MRCQEEGEGEEDDPPLVPRLGTRTGSTLLFSTTTRFSDMKQKRNYSFLTSRSIAKTSYTIRSSGVLLQTGRVFLMTFIVVVKSYMEVSNETSDSVYEIDVIQDLCISINQTNLTRHINRFVQFSTILFCVGTWTGIKRRLQKSTVQVQCFSGESSCCR